MTLRLPRALALMTAALVLLGGVPAGAHADSAPVAGASGSSSAPPPTAGAAPRGPLPRPLARDLHGSGAARALGADLRAVAARHHLSATGLGGLLERDHTAWVSQEGQVYFREDRPSAATTGTSATATALTPAYPTGETFRLHSRPGAARTIYLDMDGAVVAGTAWNSGAGAMSSGSYSGWDSDGRPSTFDAAEHAWVQEVWRQVAETYAPFDVDVTTADPGVAGLTRSAGSDATYGTHVVITRSTTAAAQACESACLGIAFLSTFDLVDPTGAFQPAWVFASAGMSPTVAAQAAAHETGHTLGLTHDGLGTADYYAGTPAWGPVMGSAMPRAVTQWSRGEYAGASNTQDDLAIISTHLPLRADDHGSSVLGADHLGAHTAYAVTGVIGARTDTDVFALDRTCADPLLVSARGIGAQGALDLSLDVLDATGTVVGHSAPPSGWTGSRSAPVSTGLDAAVDLALDTGRYYVRVDGVGQGDPTGIGWSDYGSLGAYTLTLSGCATPGEPGTSVFTPASAPGAPAPAAVVGPVTGAPAPAVVAVRAPSPPRIGLATSGARRGPVTAVARWASPTSTGGAPITHYRVVARRLGTHDRVVRLSYSAFQRPTGRAVALRLPRGRYTFCVAAWNRTGHSGWSRASRVVLAR